MRLLVSAQVPDEDWRKAWRLAFAQLRTEVDLHPRGSTPKGTFEAAVRTISTVAAESLPLAMGLVMHLYPLCALRGVPLPWWSPANYRRHRLLRAIDGHGLILANAGSERVLGTQAPVTLTRTREGALVDGVFDYVSLANAADLVLFNAPLADGANLFCIANLHAETVSVGPPRFQGSLKLSDTSWLTFKNHFVRADHFVVVPTEQALRCMAQYQRSWFQLLAGQAHLARLEFLGRRWQLPRTPEQVVSFNELGLLRDHALHLLNTAARPAAIEKLARVSAAIKLRISWHCQAVASVLRDLDATAAMELGYLQRQPTADDRILSGIGAVSNGPRPKPVTSPAASNPFKGILLTN